MLRRPNLSHRRLKTFLCTQKELSLIFMKRDHLHQIYRVYRGAVIISGIFTFFFILTSLDVPPLDRYSLPSCLCYTLAIGLMFWFPIPTQLGSIVHTMDHPLYLALFLLYGPIPTTIATLLTFWVTPLRMGWKIKQLSKLLPHLLFNWGVFILSMGAGTAIFHLAGGTFYYSVPKWSVPILPALAADYVRLMAHSILVATSVSLRNKQKWKITWLLGFKWVNVPALLTSLLGVTIAYLHSYIGPLALVPFVVVLLSAREYIRLHIETARVYLDSVSMLGSAMHQYHPYTSKHQLSVAAWAERLAEKMKLPTETVLLLKYAGLLHDIGKIRWGEDILDKEGALSPYERNLIRDHPVDAEQTVRKIRYLRRIAPWIRHHHERWDGSGYPDGLKGQEIPLEASILAVADAYHAMLSNNRKYQRRLTREEAIEEIRREAGRQFHPQVAKALIQILEGRKNRENSSQSPQEVSH